MVIDTVVVGLIKTNCYIVSNNNGKCVIIDPGANPRAILERVKQRGLTPEYVFVTHVHYDHFTAVPELRDEYGFKLAAHELDVPGFSDYTRSHYRGKRPVECDIAVTDGHIIELDGMTFKWLHTPGHSLGACVIQCEDTLFTGDTLFYEECGRCDFFGGSYPRMMESLRRLAELEGDYTVLPGHGEATSLNHERGHNIYMREATGG